MALNYIPGSKKKKMQKATCMLFIKSGTDTFWQHSRTIEPGLSRMSNSPLSIIKFRIIFIICWLVMMADNAMVLHFFGLPWNAAIIDSAICNTLLLLICLLVMNTLRYYLPRGNQYINIFSLCLFLTIIWLLISKWLLGVSLGHYPGIKICCITHSLSGSALHFSCWDV